MKYIVMPFMLSLVFSQTGPEIARMVDAKKSPKDMISRTTMILTNSKGKTRTNTMFSKSIDGGKKQIIWFLEPADDRGVAFLKIEHEGKDDEMRMWLPAFKKIRRISSKKKGDSFMGSDLSYEDMTSRDLSKNDYNRLADQKVDGVDCYVLETIPKLEAESSYKKHVTWISIEDLTFKKEESYDRHGILKKVKTFTTQRLKTYDVMKEIYVKDVQKNHTTRIAFDELTVDTGIQESMFQEKNLKRMPR